MSHAPIGKVRLTKACKKIIAHVEKYRIREKRLFVRDRLRQQKKRSERSFIGWFYPWPVSKKDILKYLDFRDSWDYASACTAYHDSLKCAESLLALAIHIRGENVFVSSDDMAYIKKWL